MKVTMTKVQDEMLDEQGFSALDDGTLLLDGDGDVWAKGINEEGDGLCILLGGRTGGLTPESSTFANMDCPRVAPTGTSVTLTQD